MDYQEFQARVEELFPVSKVSWEFGISSVDASNIFLYAAYASVEAYSYQIVYDRNNPKPFKITISFLYDLPPYYFESSSLEITQLQLNRVIEAIQLIVQSKVYPTGN